MNNNKKIEDILASDDEFPSDCEDVPECPAYQQDNRFEKVKFGWIDSNFSKFYEKKINQEVKLPVLYSSLNKDTLYNKTANLAPQEQCFILGGVLGFNDVYCLKSIEPSASDSFFLWFLNFLLYKDLLTNYSFLKTCLVSNYHNFFDAQMTQTYLADCKSHNFDLVIT